MSQPPANTKDLEDQLRGMILSNVTIAGGPNHYDSQPGQHRGRGRGRGGFYRDNGPNHRGGYAHHNNTRGAPSYGVNAASPSIRGGRPGAQNSGMSSQYQHAHTHAHMSQRNDAPSPQIMQRPQGGFNQAGQVPRGGSHHQYPRPQYVQNGYQSQPRIDTAVQLQFMDEVVQRELPRVQMTETEISKHNAFRRELEIIMRQAFSEQGGEDLDHIKNISLVAFGSLGSGFGLPGSDMDLAVVPEWCDPSRADDTDIGPRIPRLLERAVLDAKLGGRLLTRTRVPILKVCETPTDALYSALSDEREKWESLPEEEKYPRTPAPIDPTVPPPTLDKIKTKKVSMVGEQRETTDSEKGSGVATSESATVPEATSKETVNAAVPAPTMQEEVLPSISKIGSTESTTATSTNKEHQNRPEKQWHREKILGPLDFPKSGVGIQCDINFANPLGIHNTHMLRCYSLTDPRVRPMVLFVKSWAKRRKINSSYSGTLSSYGWVLMVLHYLVNVASPPVCPNLQHCLPQRTDMDSLAERVKDAKMISGYEVRFWRNEEDITRAAQEGKLTQNRQPLSSLLCGFFRYFASQGGHYGRQTNFYWTSEVLSIRTPGGILSKQDKGWVSATTVVTAEKKVTNRYLFAIEDPFEVDHNVARTVTHRGIVTIRDEFRRAGRILGAVGRGMVPEGGLFDEVIEEAPAPITKVEQPEAKKDGDEPNADTSI
ncbi:poly rna polymerase cid13 [Stagonosporopsis vannaccii]|nr:poly rna polymerase cid13 [Stagonosporopsis vannaccii]